MVIDAVWFMWPFFIGLAIMGLGMGYIEQKKPWGLRLFKVGLIMAVLSVIVPVVARFIEPYLPLFLR